MTNDDLDTALRSMPTPEFTSGMVIDADFIEPGEKITADNPELARLALYLRQLHFLLKHPESPQRIAESDLKAFRDTFYAHGAWLDGNKDATPDQYAAQLQSLRSHCDPILTTYGWKFD
ncbi:hypothetical protein OG259_18800 [Streptomyces sp. NBC_00250]|uniref:hypothetical protein n=1 Tax=Streptomyces sp. NBC_00250 TaxID=2903641 RepID=UPI002E2B0DD0|nr:hypothetical protein [Streptomyces sp. NBC_00250]